MATAKLLINGESGVGKTALLASLGKETFVISRDSKKFTLPIPHMLVDTYYDMTTLLFGNTITEEDGTEVRIEGVVDKLEKYNEKFGEYPDNVVIDTVSQLVMDIIDSAAEIPTAWGEQGAFITKEIAMLTKFIHEYLEMNGMTVILLNHVIPEKIDGKLTGSYVQFGQGKFLSKGGFFSTVDESILIKEEGSNRVVYTRGTGKIARTLMSIEKVPTKIYVKNIVEPDKSKKLKEGESYFNLKEYLDLIKSKDLSAEKWAI